MRRGHLSPCFSFAPIKTPAGSRPACLLWYAFSFAPWPEVSFGKLSAGRVTRLGRDAGEGR